MLIKHTVLVSKGSENIGKFSKVIDMPCVTPIGCYTTFGSGISSFTGKVSEVSYHERDCLFVAFYTTDIYSEQDRLKDYISDDYFPKKLVIDCGFEIDWLEEEYDDLYAKLTST